MRIAINGLSAKTGGGVTYLNRLIAHLHRIDTQNEYYIFVTSFNRKLIIDFEDERLKVIEVGIKNLLHRLFYEQAMLPCFLKKFAIDVLYSPAEIVPLIAPCKVVLGVQNPNVYYPKVIKRSLYEELRLRTLRVLAKLSSKKASRVIFVSNTACKDIAKELNLYLNKCRPICHGVEIDKFGRIEHEGGKEKIKHTIGTGNYILCVSNVARHKNLEMLIDAYVRLNSLLIDRYMLVIVGKKLSPYYDELIKLVRYKNYDANVIFTDEIAFNDLPAIYRGASLFVLPSYLETFGIPLIEAMASRIPIVTSDLEVIHEICGDAAVYFDPFNAEDMAKKMLKVLSDHKVRKDLIENGFRRVQHFSWEKCARETLKVFKELL